MQATLNQHVIADSDDIVECAGYQYFPAAAVRAAERVLTGMRTAGVDTTDPAA
jgi:hypothetical protein